MDSDKLHLKAPGSWINDPNGFIYYRGEYHLFYQYFPYDTQWGTMHWGHAISQDLVNWEHGKIALFPTKSFDRNGCFSGSAIEADGKLYLYYTAVKYEAINEENVHVIVNDQFESSQALIISEDGYAFDNFTRKQQILPPITDGKLGDRTHTRDPKVWKYRDSYYMVLGTKTTGKMGKLLFYKSEDLLTWTYVNAYSKPGLGYMWECPDLFTVDGRAGQEQTVLLMSPEGIKEGTLYTSQAICSLVTFQEEQCELTIPEHYQMVDYGLDLYAPQTNLDAEGRRVMIGWMRMPRKVERQGQESWIGMMALPRVIEVDKDHIYFRVHPHVEQSFATAVNAIESLDYTKPFQLKAVLCPTDRLDIGGYKIWIEDDKLHADRTEVFAGLEGYDLQFQTPKLNGNYELNIFVEPNLIEIFVNEGEYVLSNIVYELKKYVRSTAELAIRAQ